MTLRLARELQAEPEAGAAVARFALTDSGNGEFFATHHGADLRFDHRRGRWLLWRGHRWQPDADGEVRRLAKAAMRQRLEEAVALGDSDGRVKAVRWAIASEARARIEALLYLAQAERPIADAGDAWDADPWLLGCPNGVVDLRTGTLRPGHRDDGITMTTAAGFDPDATCPRFEQFIIEIFSGDLELAAFAQRAVGYSLSGRTDEQVVLLCHGAGSNGKSTLLSTLASVFGDYAFNMPFATIELQQRGTIPNDLAALAGRRFVSASETNDGTRLNESRLKALTGGDPITARFLHQEFFTFTPVATFWLAVNHKPIVRDDSPGFWRRVRLVPFTEQFPVDPTLAPTLRAEAAGVLAWAVRGCLAWQRDGLAAPAVVLEGTRIYQDDSDPLAGFLAEAIELAPGVEVTAGDAFQHYSRWADRQGLGKPPERLTATGLGRKLGERFPTRTVHGRKHYVGLSRVGCV